MKLLHRVLIEDNDNVQKVGNVINEDIMFIMSSTLVHNQNDNVAGSIGGVSEVWQKISLVWQHSYILLILIYEVKLLFIIHYVVDYR